MYAIGCPEFGYGEHPKYAVVMWNGYDTENANQRHEVRFQESPDGPPNLDGAAFANGDKAWTVAVAKLYASCEPIDAIDTADMSSMSILSLLQENLRANLVGRWVRQAAGDLAQSKDRCDTYEPRLGAMRECEQCGGALQYRTIQNCHREDIAKGWCHI